MLLEQLLQLVEAAAEMDVGARLPLGLLELLEVVDAGAGAVPISLEASDMGGAL